MTELIVISDHSIYGPDGNIKLPKDAFRDYVEVEEPIIPRSQKQTLWIYEGNRRTCSSCGTSQYGKPKENCDVPSHRNIYRAHLRRKNERRNASKRGGE